MAERRAFDFAPVFALRSCARQAESFDSVKHSMMKNGPSPPRRTRTMSERPQGANRMAEREGFEPSNPFWGLRDFESRAFNHSAISPQFIVIRAQEKRHRERRIGISSVLSTHGQHQKPPRRQLNIWPPLASEVQKNACGGVRGTPRIPARFYFLPPLYELRCCLQDQGVHQCQGHDVRRRSV